MSIRPELFDYLDHFGRTRTVRELAEDPHRRDAVALRHDIDHNLDLALELAHHEHRRGMRATYYLLHTHPYWGDRDFAAKCRQLVDYGHEVGLHVNVLTEWATGQCNDVDARLDEALIPLRDAGVEIVGVSAHGDRACYEHGFINYWLWKELRGDDPAQRERGRSAEGVPVDDPQWQVRYPGDHRLKRADGATLDLWQSSLDELGLKYDAMHVPFDHYWTDSGGNWDRSGDPLKADLSRGRHQVLLHPWWWRGEQKLYLFLSTARCGTVWLSQFIDRATSATGLHEWTLNHRYEGETLIEDKRTSNDYDTLCRDRTKAVNLMRQSLRSIRQMPGDVAEANVYLEPFITELRELAPRATIVHLHRDGRDVVRSILNRGWYDNPGDHKHRVVPVEGWDELNRFERACWYWRYTNEAIAPHASTRLAFEQIVSDRAALEAHLEQLGIIVHPLLADAVYDQPLNVTRQPRVPSHEEWPEQYRQTFERICGPVQAMLGYPAPHAAPPPRTDHSGASGDRASARVVLDLDFTTDRANSVSPVNVQTRRTADGLIVQPGPVKSGARNLALLLTNGQWSRVAAGQGVPCVSGEFYRCRVDAQASGAMRCRVFVLFYASNEQLRRKLQVGTLRADEPQREFAFAPALGASHFALALHLGDQSPGESLTVRRVQVMAAPMGREYSATPRTERAGVAGPSAST